MKYLFRMSNGTLLIMKSLSCLVKEQLFHAGLNQENLFLPCLLFKKKNGKFRPVLNSRYLNLFVHYDHFKQETFKVILDLVQKNDYFTSIDLSDAYFSVPIHSDYQKYLKFSWNGQLFKFFLPSIWIKVCSICVHKDSQACICMV